jgi:uncharacterized membrane protein YGL010W
VPLPLAISRHSVYSDATAGVPARRCALNLAHYMAQYDHEHTSTWNKLLHGIGIPMIFVGIALLIPMKWIWGAGIFIGGWALLFLGHRIEGNHPAFFQGAVYLLVGPIWVAREVWMFLRGEHRARGSEATRAKQS